MALRIRKDGRILCAAMHDEEEGDFYIPDDISYKLTVELRAIVTEAMNSGYRGGHAKHGEWWWANDIPPDVIPEEDLGEKLTKECSRCGSPIDKPLFP